LAVPRSMAISWVKKLNKAMLWECDYEFFRMGAK
jgi:hypothetical protein